MNINIPDEYKVNSKIPIKEFIPKFLKPEQKRRIRNSIISVIITHQIAGQKIPSFVDENNRCEVIQFFDIEIGNMKDAPFVANIYQAVIKSPCVIHFYDAVSESYSFGLKRLNRQDENEIVVEYAFITKRFSRVLLSSQLVALLSAISYENIRCKVNKLSFYNEMFVKAYVVHNDTAYQKAFQLLNTNLWYDADKTVALYLAYKDLVSQKYMLSKSTTQAEKLPYNIKIKKNIEILNQFLEEK